MPTALVTVGSTLFPDLIAAFDPSGEVFKALQDAHFDKLLVQYGNGSPPRTASVGGALQVDAFRFSDEIDTLIAKSDLVISHAGSSFHLSPALSPR
jgi:UDP-N-acetylglucosamine transferase subunit ALG13